MGGHGLEVKAVAEVTWESEERMNDTHFLDGIPALPRLRSSTGHFDSICAPDCCRVSHGGNGKISYSDVLFISPVEDPHVATGSYGAREGETRGTSAKFKTPCQSARDIEPPKCDQQRSRNQAMGLTHHPKGQYHDGAVHRITNQ